jgi:hypothetical protein
MSVTLPPSLLQTLSLSDFNPVSDAQQVYDGVMTGGSAVLTSASGKFSPSDVGKIICVQNAGAYHGKLVTTIASYQSATQVTLAQNASYSVSSGGPTIGSGVTWGTDNSPAFQAALNYLTTITTAGIQAGGLAGVDLIIPSGCYALGASISWTSPTEYPRLRIIGQGDSTKMFVIASDGGTPGNYLGQTLLSIHGPDYFEILNMVWIGTPGATTDVGIMFSFGTMFKALIDCDFFWLSPYSAAGQGLITFTTNLTLRSRFRGCCGGNIVYGLNWTGFADEGSFFHDLGTLDGVNQFAKSLSPAGLVALSAIWLGTPYQVESSDTSFFGQNKVWFKGTYVDEDFGQQIVISAALNAIREVEFDNVRINGSHWASTPAINISGVQLVTVNAWVGYNVTNVNSAITLANVGTAYLKRLSAKQSSNVITAASTVGTLILEDCVYTTLTSSATVTIVTQQGQIAPPSYTVATLPAASAANKGFRATVTDQLTSLPAFGAALTGGGALACPCWSTGSAWVAG